MLGFGHSRAELQEILGKPTVAIIFYHIHKTAGTTVERAICDQMGADALPCHGPQEKADIIDRASKGEFRGRRVFIYGHETVGVAEALSQFGYMPRDNIFRFTFVRDPKARMESMYNFLRVRKPSFGDSFEKYLKNYPENALSKFLQMTDVWTWLRDEIEFVGVQERFESSFSILLTLLGLDTSRAVNAHLINANKPFVLEPIHFGKFYQRASKDYLVVHIAQAAVQYVEQDFGMTRVEVRTSEQSFVKRTQLNLNLEKNNDHISLLETGYSLFDSDPDRAVKFFVKSAQLNLHNFPAIKTFLSKRDEHRLRQIEGSLQSLIQKVSSNRT